MHELSETIDDRAHHSYKILWELRDNASWGHLPPNTEMFDFFDSIKTHTGPVHQILEFGTNLGFSSMMQLETNPDATITSFDIAKVSIKYARTELKPVEGMTLDLSDLAGISSQALLSFLYGKRFHYKIASSATITKHPSLCSKQWSYIFVDGGHNFDEALTDIDNAVYKLQTDFILVDNMLSGGATTGGAKRAADIYVEKGLIAPIAEHTYRQNRYRKESGFDGSRYEDKMILFKKIYK